MSAPETNPILALLVPSGAPVSSGPEATIAAAEDLRQASAQARATLAPLATALDTKRARVTSLRAQLAGGGR